MIQSEIHDDSPNSSSGRIKINRIALIIIIVGAIFFICLAWLRPYRPPSGGRIDYKQAPESTTQKELPPQVEYPIKFAVLKDHNFTFGDRGLASSGTRKGRTFEILVSASANRDKIMKLAQVLFDENKNKQYLMLNIFDSQEAYDNRGNEEYSEKEYWKHFLVQGNYNAAAGKSELIWCAENRGH